MNKDVPWRFEQIYNDKSLYDILKEMQKLFKLSEGDIYHILTRTRNLKDKISTKGRSNKTLVLTCTYLYINQPDVKKVPINIHKYVSICKKHNHNITVKNIIDNSQIFKDAKIFPKKARNIMELYESYWQTISQYFKLDDQIKNEVLNIIKNNKIISGKTRNVIFAGSTYYITKKHDMNITQVQLATFFGVTEVSIRNFTKHLKNILK